MLIRFRCRHCKKSLGVKKELAGKKAKCPVCKKPIIIPSPAAKPAVDVEALAAAALADEPEQKDEAPKSIDFTCDWCGEAVSMALEMAGKREPCPSCKRIVRVPVPETKKDDWRTIKQTGPSAALINQQEKLEGEWGTQTAQGRVSKESLVEADAMPIFEPDEPPGVIRWIKRVALTAVCVAIVVGAVVGLNRQQREADQKSSLDSVLPYTRQGKDVDAKERLSTLMVAELHRQIGEYYLGRNNWAKAREHLQSARGMFPPVKNLRATAPLENDLFLIRLAESQVALGMPDEDVKEKKGVGWKDMADQLQGTINRIHFDYAQAKALRQVNAKLQALKQEPVAMTLVPRFAPPGKSKQAKTSPVFAQFIAALLEQGQDAKNHMPPPPPGKVVDPAQRLGYAEGYARQGKIDEARELFQAAKYPGFPIDRLRTALAVADVVLQTGEAAAKPIVEDALKIAGELQGAIPQWELLQMIDLLARTGDTAKAEQFKKSLDKKLHSWAEHSVFAARLAELQKNRQKAPPELAEEIKQPNSLPRALAWEQISRHNTELGYRNAMRPQLEFPDDKRVLPFIHVGIALGEQDRER